MRINVINLAIADDHLLFLKGLSTMLATQPDFSVVIEAINGKDLLEKIANSNIQPDVCLLDVRMPVMNGFEVLNTLRKLHPGIKVLVVSSHDHEHVIVSMLRNGAKGYLLKGAEPDETFSAIRRIHEKGFYHSELVPDYFEKVDATPVLNETEHTFLRLCCDELTYKEIGLQMHLSSRTIESLRMSLFEKLDVKSRTGLVMFAVRNGMV